MSGPEYPVPRFGGGVAGIGCGAGEFVITGLQLAENGLNFAVCAVGGAHLSYHPVQFQATVDAHVDSLRDSGGGMASFCH